MARHFFSFFKANLVRVQGLNFPFGNHMEETMQRNQEHFFISFPEHPRFITRLLLTTTGGIAIVFLRCTSAESPGGGTGLFNNNLARARSWLIYSRHRFVLGFVKLLLILRRKL